jgi:hypothetical protein
MSLKNRSRCLMLALCSALSLTSQLGLVEQVHAAEKTDQSKPQGPTLRAEVAKPLSEANDFLSKKQYVEAMAKINDAIAVKDKTGYEETVINQLRAQAALGLNDQKTALAAFEYAANSDFVDAATKPRYIELIVKLAFNVGDYGKVQSWGKKYYEVNGQDLTILDLMARAEYITKNYAGSVKLLDDLIAKTIASGQAPTEIQFDMLAGSYNELKDIDGYAGVLDRKLAYYPSKDDWTERLALLASSSKFADRLLLDVYRLRKEVGVLSDSEGYLAFAELAVSAGYPKEAQDALALGYEKGLIAPNNDKIKKYRDRVNKFQADDLKSQQQTENQANAAKDGAVLVAAGYSAVTNGQVEKGLAMIDRGLAKGVIKLPEDVKLHAAIAYFLAGNKVKAAELFNQVGGLDGTKALAQLWLLRTH